MKTVKSFIACICLVLLSQGAFAQDTKIGVLNALQALFNSDPARVVQEELEQEFASDAPTPLAALEHDESLEALRGAIDQLPHDQKSVLLLHYFDRLSYREIAEITGCSERGVETRLYRARRQLHKALKPVIEDAPTG